LFDALCRLAGRQSKDNVDLVSIDIHVPVRSQNGVVHITSREREVLRLASLGFGTVEIARQMCITQQAVYNLQSRLYKKLRVRNRTECVAYALREGLID